MTETVDREETVTATIHDVGNDGEGEMTDTGPGDVSENPENETIYIIMGDQVDTSVPQQGITETHSTNQEEETVTATIHDVGNDGVGETTDTGPGVVSENHEGSNETIYIIMGDQVDTSVPQQGITEAHSTNQGSEEITIPALEILKSGNDDGLTDIPRSREQSTNTPLVHHDYNARCPGTGVTPRYKCDMCPWTFHWQSAYKRHTLVHVNDKRHKCSDCGKGFNNPGNLKNHIRIHTGEKPYKCEVCGKQFRESGQLRVHTRIHTGARPFACKVCGIKFRKSGHLEQHLRTHSGDKPFKCPECGKAFRQESILQRHALIHTGEMPHKCDGCEKSFRQRTTLCRHQRTVHDLSTSGENPQRKTDLGRKQKRKQRRKSGPETGSNTNDVAGHIDNDDDKAGKEDAHKPDGISKLVFLCFVCHSVFVEKELLSIHVNEHMTDPKYRFKCGECFRLFRWKSAYEKHLSIHVNDKSHKCSDCGKGFNNPGNLKNHVRIHSGVKPYKCKECGKQFRESGQLVSHVRIHTGDRPFWCQVCGYKFRKSSHLEVHLRTHSGKKPFTCDDCGKAFRQESTFKRHALIHKGVKPYTCDVCDRIFRQRSTLVKHKATHKQLVCHYNKTLKSYECDVCKHKFKRECNFLYHKQTKHVKIEPDADEQPSNT